MQITLFYIKQLEQLSNVDNIFRIYEVTKKRWNVEIVIRNYMYQLVVFPYNRLTRFGQIPFSETLICTNEFF